jgi:hypothetical protein
VNKKQLKLLKELLAEIQDDINLSNEGEKRLIKDKNFRGAADNEIRRKTEEYYFWRLTLVLNGQTIVENRESLLNKMKKKK